MRLKELETLSILGIVTFAMMMGCNAATTDPVDVTMHSEEDTTDGAEGDTSSDSSSDSESSSSSAVDCDACHGDPPLTGAHGTHVTTLEMPCRTCHGHDGSGPLHNSGELDLAFDTSVVYPAGTTMDNGHTAFADLGADPITCLVGCHNPVVGDSVELTNTVEWTATTLSCVDCHEKVGLALPNNHPMGTSVAEINSRCAICHDLSDHTMGDVDIEDPDPTDQFEYGNDPTELRGLCFTCHDGSGTTFSGVAPLNLVGLHPDKHPSYDCSDCHGYHTNGPGSLALKPGGCHDNGCHSH